MFERYAILYNQLPWLMKWLKTQFIQQICDALPQNREQVIFWVKWVSGIIIRSTLSAFFFFFFFFFLIPKSNSYTYYFLRYDHLYIKTVSAFSGSENLRNQPLKFHILIVLDLTGCRKCRIFCGKLFEIINKLHGGDIEHIKVCKKSQNWQMSCFSPLYQLQLSISQNRPVRLVPCFVGLHHIFYRTCRSYSVWNMFG